MNNNKKVLACASFGGHWIQLGRIVEELGIEMFPASSPQAKGRI